MSTAIIPIEDLFAAYADFRDGHGKALSAIYSSMAIISTISSSVLIRMILSSSSRLSTTCHRVLLGMTVGDIVISLSFMTFGAMIPSDMSYMVWNAQGNQATCNILGFMTVLGFTLTMLYNCSLMFYSLAVVKHNKTDYYIRRNMEPFLLGVPFVIALANGVVLLRKGYNSNLRNNCHTPTYDPPHCIGIEDGHVREGFEIPCGRGLNGPAPVIYHVAFFVLMLGTPIIVITTLVTLFRDVSQQEGRMARYGAAALNQGAPEENTDNAIAAADGGGSGTSRTISSMVSFVKGTFGRLMSQLNSNHEDSNSRRVVHRALAYSSAYFLSWSWSIAQVVLRLAGVPIPLPLSYLVVIFTPLQGFFNLLVFIQPSVVQAKRSHGGSLSWCQAFAKAFRFSVSDEPNTMNNDTRIPRGEEEEEKMETQANRHNSTNSEPGHPAHATRHGDEEEKAETTANLEGSIAFSDPICSTHIAVSRIIMRQRLSQKGTAHVLELVARRNSMWLLVESRREAEPGGKDKGMIRDRLAIAGQQQSGTSSCNI